MEEEVEEEEEDAIHSGHSPIQPAKVTCRSCLCHESPLVSRMSVTDVHGRGVIAIFYLVVLAFICAKTNSCYSKQSKAQSCSTL